MNLLKIILETERNLNEFAKKEIEKIIGTNVYENEFGLLEFETDDFTTSIVRIFLFSETVYNLYLWMGYGEVKKPQDYYEIASNISWSELWDVNKTFAVRPQVKNQEEIKIIGKHVGQAIVDDFKRRFGTKIKVNLSRPDFEVFVWKKDSKILLGLNLNGEKRLNEFENVLARSSLMFAEWSGEESLGEVLYAGTSLSAYRYSANMPRRERLLNTPLIRLNLLDKKRTLELLRRSWKKEPTKIVLYERISKLNVLKQEEPEISRLIIRDIEELKNTNEDILISNLWLGLEKKSEQEEWLEKILNMLKENSQWKKLVIITTVDVKNIPFLIANHKELSLKGNQVHLIAILNE